ncbi:MAG: ATP phosphoribosyltransferase regulatory subunit [Pleomorphochaeta sp.]
MQEVFEKYGYSPVKIPILCYRDLLASKYSEGADILKEIYKLTDQGKRELGLRYDLTFCKAYQYE